jgi:dihydrofolate reductase
MAAVQIDLLTTRQLLQVTCGWAALTAPSTSSARQLREARIGATDIDTGTLTDASFRMRLAAMGLLTFSLNVTLDGCVDHQEGIADDETHAFFTRLMDESGAMLWGRVTYEMMEGYWPAVARGDEEAPPVIREWAVKLQAKPKYVVSSTRKDFPWSNSHPIAGDLRMGVQKLKDATPAGVLLGSGKLATELDRLDLIDEYKFLVHPRLAGHGPTLYQSGLPATRRLELVSAKPLRCGAVAMHYRRSR